MPKTVAELAKDDSVLAEEVETTVSLEFPAKVIVQVLLADRSVLQFALTPMAAHKMGDDLTLAAVNAKRPKA